jgi:hypothetical protein
MRAAFAAFILSSFVFLFADDSADLRPPWDAGLLCSFNRGDVSDRSWGANTGTLNNGATVSTHLTLDGTNDNLSFPDSAGLDVGGTFSVSVWFQPSSPGSTERTLAGRYISSNPNRSWTFQLLYDVNAMQGITCSDGTTATLALYQFATTLPTTGWHHAVMVYDSTAGAGARMKAYMDGAAVNVSTIVLEGARVPYDTGNVTTIGSYGSAASPLFPWKGDIDSVIIFRRALTANEVGAIYASGRR